MSADGNPYGKTTVFGHGMVSGYLQLHGNSERTWHQRLLQVEVVVSPVEVSLAEAEEVEVAAPGNASWQHLMLAAPGNALR